MDSREKALVGGEDVPGFLAWPILATAVRGEIVVVPDEAPVVGPTGLDGDGLLGSM